MVSPEIQDPEPLPYLKESNHYVYDIQLDVFLNNKSLADRFLLSSSNAKYLYWSFAQQLAHHTIAGCNMQPGDLLGSGTISGNVKFQISTKIQFFFCRIQVHMVQCWSFVGKVKSQSSFLMEVSVNFLKMEMK
jgi:2-keto-4-pentenoate hydratase/2-oxohepta-3-ene-1,7-dioic acid hydratase in catechol pathway